MKPKIFGHEIDITSTLDLIEDKIFKEGDMRIGLKPRGIEKLLGQIDSNMFRLPFPQVNFVWQGNRWNKNDGTMISVMAIDATREEAEKKIGGRITIGDTDEYAYSDRVMILELNELYEHHGQPERYGMIINIDYNSESRYLGDSGISFYTYKPFADRYFPLTESDMREPDGVNPITVMLLMGLPVINAILLLNCKNVVLEDEPKASMKRMLNRHKRDKKPIYKILHIHPLRIKNSADRESFESGIKKSIHVCRGHFRTYTDERPLFGKVAGTFFISAHIRGDEKEGTVLKDYSLDKE